MQDAAGTFDTVIQICVNATRLHPTNRQPYLFTGASPWIVDGVPVSNPTNTSGDAAEVQKWRQQFGNLSAHLADSNERLGTNVHIGHVQFDMVSPRDSLNFHGFSTQNARTGWDLSPISSISIEKSGILSGITRWLVPQLDR